MTTDEETPDEFEEEVDVQKFQEDSKKRLVFVLTWVVGGLIFVIFVVAVVGLGVIMINAVQSASESAASAAASAEETKNLAQENKQLQEDIKALTQERVNTAEDIKSLIAKADLITSEDAKAAADASLKAKLEIVLQQADCNTAARLNEAFVAAGLLTPGSVAVCEDPIPEIPG